jgi:hypothetical protein
MTTTKNIQHDAAFSFSLVSELTAAESDIRLASRRLERVFADSSQRALEQEYVRRVV